MDSSRRRDLEQLREDFKKETDPNIRKQISDAAHRIRNEDGRIASMREALIREKRHNREDNVRDIREEAFKDRSLQNKDY